MVDVEDLDEGTDGGAAEDLTLGHGLGDLAGSLVDASEEAVTIVAALGVVKGTDDDGLLACIAAVEDDNNLTSTEESLCHINTQTKKTKNKQKNKKKATGNNRK